MKKYLLKPEIGYFFKKDSDHHWRMFSDHRTRNRFKGWENPGRCLHSITPRGDANGKYDGCDIQKYRVVPTSMKDMYDDDGFDSLHAD